MSDLISRPVRSLRDDARPRASVTFLPRKITVTARAGDTVLDAALDHGVWIEHECGGNCSCTTCHVRVVEGADGLSEIEEPEAHRLELVEDRTAGSRLACQALLRGGAVMIELSG